MRERPTDPANREERLDRVIAEFLEQSATAPEADRRRWLARYPEFFDELSDYSLNKRLFFIEPRFFQKKLENLQCFWNNVESIKFSLFLDKEAFE